MKMITAKEPFPLQFVVPQELIGIIWDAIRTYNRQSKAQSDESFLKIIAEENKTSSSTVKIGDTIYPVIPLLLTPAVISKTSSGCFPKTLEQTASLETKVSEPGIVSIYTDGSSLGNPGPSGYAAHLIYSDGSFYEAAKSISKSTNNIAELKAIELGLELFIETVGIHRVKSINIFSDSQYSIGVLDKNWNAKTNVELIDAIKRLIAKLRITYAITFNKVAGHSGDPNNERVDFLANQASHLQISS
jgi:ribonuclease HI